MSMNDSSNRRPVMVGLFVFIGLAILIAGILMIGNLHETFKRKMKIIALFEDVGGLQAGNNVWFSGVKIGTVKSLHFYKESQVQVIINIEVKAQEYIRKNAMIKTGTDGLIGNKILIIYGGSPRAPQVEDGDTLLVEKSFSQEDMVNTFQESNTNLKSITMDIKKLSATLASGEGTIGKFINDNHVYDNIEATTGSLRRASSNAEQLLLSLNTFTTGLNSKEGLAHELATDTVVFKSLKNAVQQLAQIVDTVGLIATSLTAERKNPTGTLGVLLYDTASGARMKTMIINMESSSRNLNEDLEAAQHNFLLRRYFKKKEKEKRDSLKY
jgi:phospholipid/cholesterol/gamma-HCH transport system substrate-binding protein